MAGQDEVTLARASITEGAPKVVFDMDEAEARRLGLSLADVAGQLEAALVGQTGGTLVEGTEALPIRVRLGDDAAIRYGGDCRYRHPARRGRGEANDGRVSGAAAVGHRRDAPRARRGHDHPPQRRAGEHAFRPSSCAASCPRRRWRACRPRWRRGFALPAGYRLDIGGDSDARSSTLNNLLAPLGLIVTLSIAVVVMTFRSFRLATVALVVSGLSAGLSMLALAIFDFPVRDQRDHRPDRIHRGVDQRGADHHDRASGRRRGGRRAGRGDDAVW
jgi:hypothetical protein